LSDKHRYNPVDLNVVATQFCDVQNVQNPQKILTHLIGKLI